MKIDTGLHSDITKAADVARRAEDAGYDGLFGAEIAHDPFLPLALAAQATSRIELGTGIAVAFARNPMTLAVIGHDLQRLSQGRFVLGVGSQIKPHVTVWWSTGQQPAQLLLDKEVVLATGWNGRFYDIIKKGAPVAIEWNEGALKQGSFAIPRGAKSPYWANKMLAELAVPQQQAVYASELGYPGLNLESLNFVDPKVKPFLPTAYLDQQFWISDEWYAENGTKAAELWNAWMLKKG